MPTAKDTSEVRLLMPPPRPNERAFQQRMVTEAIQKSSFAEVVDAYVKSITDWENLEDGPRKEKLRRFCQVISVEELTKSMRIALGKLVANPVALLGPNDKKKNGEKSKRGEGGDRKAKSGTRTSNRRRAKATCSIDLIVVSIEGECPDNDDIVGNPREVNCVTIEMMWEVCTQYTLCDIERCNWWGYCSITGETYRERTIDGCSV